MVSDVLVLIVAGASGLGVSALIAWLYLALLKMIEKRIHND